MDRREDATPEDIGPRFRPHDAAGGDAGAAAERSRPRELVTEDEWHRRRRPEPVEEILGRVMAKVSRGRAAAATRLAARWSEVVGDQFAGKTRPGSCDGGRLVIVVADGATASKLRFATAQIMQNAAAIVGEGEVSSISFRVRPGIGE